MSLGIDFTHGGGAWRAYIKKKLGGVAGFKMSPLVMRRLGKQYRELSREDRKRLAIEGKIMTEAYRERGPLKRTAQQRRAVPAGLPAAAALRAIQDREEDEVGEDEIVPVVAPPAVGPELDEQIVAARTELRAKRLAAREEIEKESLFLVKWSESRKDALPLAVLPMRDLCLSAPCGPADIAACHVNTPFSDIVQGVLGGMPASTRTDLTESWAKRHELFKHPNVEQIGAVSKRWRALPMCHTAGICLHTASGINVAKFELGFMAAMHKMFLPKTRARKMLQQGFCIVKIDDNSIAHWYHVSYTVLAQSGWKFSLLKMLPSADCPSTLESSGEPWMLTWPAFRQYNVRDAHWVQVFVLDDWGYRFLTDVSPGKVSIKAFLPRRKFWDGLPAAAPAAPAASDHAPSDDRGRMELDLEAVARLRPAEAPPAEPHEDAEVDRDRDADDAFDLDEALEREIERAFGDVDVVAEPIDADGADFADPFRGHGHGNPGDGDAGDGDAEHDPAASSSAAAGPAPPPPVPEPPLPPPAPRGPGWRGAKGLVHERWIVPGFGEIVYSEGTSTRSPQLAAHCSCGHGLCRVNRVNVRGDRGPRGRGRPLGFLIAWLKAGRCPEFSSQESHKALSVDRAFALHPAISLEMRQEARAWAASRPEFASCFAKERPREVGEPEEPPGLP